MTDYTARNVLLKDSSGNYLIPYTEKADLSLGNLNSAGKAYVAIKGYDSTATYSLNEVVMTVVSGSVLFYRSLADNNTASLSDTTKWEEVSFGSGANIDLSNLSATGEAHFANPALTNSPYTTNRILEIPQDIKLELNDGTLTVKAGSKVYVPNGFEADGTTPKFDELTVSSDLSIAGGSSVQQVFVTLEYNLSSYNRLNPSYLASGSSNPGSGYYFWYDTTTNKIRYSSSANGTFDTNTRPFPIGLFTQGSGSITSIDQIFNGFGYIGSTVFVLPGLKLEIPNGRNTDGSYINNIATISSVKVNTTNQNGLCQFVCTDTGSIAIGSKYVYDSDRNLLKRLSDSVYFSRFILADVLYEGGKVTQFTPCNVDSVANSNASNLSKAGRSYLSSFGDPSDTYDTLTLGASDTEYTAPANGWFHISAVGSSSGYLLLRNSSNGVGMLTPVSNGLSVRVMCPCRKGGTVKVTYTATLTSVTFRFVYNVGEV